MDHQEYYNEKLLTKLVVKMLSNFAPEEMAILIYSIFKIKIDKYSLFTR
jgi:hypothetical protein